MTSFFKEENEMKMPESKNLFLAYQKNGIQDPDRIQNPGSYEKSGPSEDLVPLRTQGHMRTFDPSKILVHKRTMDSMRT